MGSFRTWSVNRVEVVDDEGSSKHMTTFEVNHNEVVKPVVSRQGSSASSSSSSSSDSEQPAEPNSPHPFHLPFATPQEQSQNQMAAAAAAGQGYQPDRIPSSIFSSKPATPTEWSTASNESLFSIHLGNNSFSKDQFFMLYKSGELTKLDEQILAQADLPPLDVLEEMAKRSESINQGISAAAPNSIKVSGEDSHHKPPTTQEDPHQVGDKENKRNPLTISMSGRSDGSNNSTRSFVFPVLTGEGGRASSKKGEQNNKGLQAQSQKQQKQQKQQQQQQPVEQKPAEQQPAEEAVQPQSPTTPQNAPAAGGWRGWFSWFSCCRPS